MMTMDISEYESLIDKIISGNFSAQDVEQFVKNTPILPILTKLNILKNKAVVEVIVTNKEGIPVPGATVILGGQTKTTDATGKATFTFDIDVPPGFIVIKKGSALSRIPFEGVRVGEKATIATVLCEGAESPLAIGESLKDVINTYYQWQLIQNIEKGVFRPELSGMPQIGVLKRKSDYEYQVYVPVPVNIKVPQLTFQPVINIPGQPPVSVPVGYNVELILTQGEGAQSGWVFNIVLKGITNPAIIKTATGSYGKYTFKNLPPGEYLLTITGPSGIITKNITISNSDVTATVNVKGQPTPPPVPPTPPVGATGEVEVRLMPAGIRAFAPGVPPPGPGLPGPSSGVTATVALDTLVKTGSYGTYHFKNIPVGMHHLVVMVNGKTIYDKMVEVKPGQVARVTVTVKEQPTPPPVPPTPPTHEYGKIVVNVVPSKPIGVRPGLTLFALAGPVVRVCVDSRCRTGSLGRYTFDNISPGEHHITVYVDNKQIFTETVSVHPGETKYVTAKYVSTTVTPGRISVAIIRGTNAPATPNLDIYVGTQHKHVTWYGTVVFANLKPGTYTVRIVDHTTNTTKTYTVSVQPGKAAFVRYIVSATGGISPPSGGGPKPPHGGIIIRPI